jgi:UDP-N-acetylmuramate dehydrogenase
MIDTLPKIRGEYRFNFPLNKTNWFNVGGPAEVLFKPKDPEDLIYFLQNKPQDINITIFGVGSNIIIRDGGLDGVVLRLGRAFTNIELLEKNVVKVGTACLNYNLANFCADNCLAGLEFLIGIPGSIGGGVAMNAGAYGVEFKDVIQQVKAVDYDGNIHIFSNEEMGFFYRGNSLKEKMIFLEAIFKLSYDDRDKISARMEGISKKREETQPIKEKTTGSTFANPPGYSAWKLIDEAGFRGFKVGGASMSEKHCNFMINDGTGTAADLENLGEYVREKVYSKTGILLEWEVKRIGKKL